MEQQSAELTIMADGAAATLAQVVAQRRATEQLNRQQHNFREDRFAAAAALQSAIVVQEEQIAKQQQLEATIAAQKLCIEQHEARRAKTGSYIFRLEQRIQNLEQSVEELRTEKEYAVERKELYKEQVYTLEQSVEELRTEKAYAVERKVLYKEHWIRKGQELRRLQARFDDLRNDESDESDSAEPNVVHNIVHL